MSKQCTGGACPHCPPFDHEAVRAHVAIIGDLLKHASDPETKAALAKMATQAHAKCVICNGKGHIRVCRSCGGRGHTVVMAKEAGHVVGEDGELREVEHDVEFNGERCANCSGCGQEAIDESQVGEA